MILKISKKKFLFMELYVLVIQANVLLVPCTPKEVVTLVVVKAVVVCLINYIVIINK